MAEQYVGIDLHRRRSVIVRMTGQGQVLGETVRIDNDPVALSLELAKAGPDPRSCSRPPTAGTGPPTCCRRAAPGCTWPTRWASRCSATSGPETDARDSTNLAELLRMGRLPEAWLAPPQVRELRELVRYRAKLVALRSGLKARGPRRARQAGVRVPMSDLFGVAGGRLLEQLRLEQLRLERAYALRVASLRRLLAAYDQQIAMLGREVGQALAGDVGYLAIQAIPGVGPVLAAIFVAEIGDVHRFASAPRLCSWAGLTPRHHQSDTTVRRGPITKQAPGWCAGPRSRPPSGSPEQTSRPPTSTASPTGAARASAASRPPAGCSRWSTTACATARYAAWSRRPRRRGERRRGQPGARSRLS